MKEVIIRDVETKGEEIYPAETGYAVVTFDKDFRAKFHGNLESKLVLKVLAKAALGSS